MIDAVTVQKIKDTADIVEVVSDYVHLVRRGANYMGLCPFHNERTPSFSVNRARNYCYCFSCHKGGSPVNFIMEKEGISYHDALLQLAKKYGIEVQEKELTDEERQAQSRREGLFIANEWAMNYFVDNLENKEEGQNVGLSYLYNRKVTPEAIKAFRLGYAIDNGTDFTNSTKAKGFSIEIMKVLGLIGTNQQGKNYDRFRGRVIFPIMNSSGKTIGFGGRDLKGGMAKYINSPESEIYVKNRELYGIFQARASIVREDKCYLVEGYLDVISMWQSGIKNVVASSGTALTDGQISLIHRFTENVVLIYDGDNAGIKASLRGIDMFLDHNMNVKAVPLPPGDDPDSLSNKLSPEELRNYLQENEIDIIRFKSKILLENAKNDPQERSKVVRSIIESLAHISDKIKRDIYIQECSQLLEIPENTLSIEIAQSRKSIVERERVRRRLDDFDRNFPETKPTVSPQDKNPVKPQKKPESNLYPLEKEVIINCLKYGFIQLWDEEMSNTPGVYQTTFEYIEEELAIDNISFNNQAFIKVFETLKQLVEQFKTDLVAFKVELEVKAENKRKEELDKIFGRGMSMDEIASEQVKITGIIENFKKSETSEFCKNYIFNQLASHEDSEIRSLTLEAYVEKHHLSNIFAKSLNADNSEEKILLRVINSINILKNGIIDEELKKLLEELKNITESSPEKERELYERISAILQLRSNMAKNIGDRILSPKGLGNGRRPVS